MARRYKVPSIVDVLIDLGNWTNSQPGAVTWTLMQTVAFESDGRMVRGFQLFVMNHEGAGAPDYLWHHNGASIADVVNAAARWLREKRS